MTPELRKKKKSAFTTKATPIPPPSLCFFLYLSIPPSCHHSSLFCCIAYTNTSLNLTFNVMSSLSSLPCMPCCSSFLCPSFCPCCPRNPLPLLVSFSNFSLPKMMRVYSLSSLEISIPPTPAPPRSDFFSSSRCLPKSSYPSLFSHLSLYSLFIFFPSLLHLLASVQLVGPFH